MERDVISIPFEECTVDLIRPCVIQVCGNAYEFSALTAIDTVTNLVVGDILIKNYTSLPTNPKKVPCVFFSNK